MLTHDSKISSVCCESSPVAAAWKTGSGNWVFFVYGTRVYQFHTWKSMLTVWLDVCRGEWVQLYSCFALFNHVLHYILLFFKLFSLRSKSILLIYRKHQPDTISFFTYTNICYVMGFSFGGGIRNAQVGFIFLCFMFLDLSQCYNFQKIRVSIERNHFKHETSQEFYAIKLVLHISFSNFVHTCCVPINSLIIISHWNLPVIFFSS